MLASSIFKITNLSFPFFINTIIIQTLGVEYLGLNMLFSSILQVLSLTELGFGTAMVFSMYEPIAKGDTAKVSALLALYRKAYLIIGCIIVVIGLVCIPILPYIIKGYKDLIHQGHHLNRIQAVQPLLEGLQAPGNKNATHEGTGRCAGNGGDLVSARLEFFNGADVGEPARSAAGQC